MFKILMKKSREFNKFENVKEISDGPSILQSSNSALNF